MLLLFALSITPKQFLHDAITGHKHSYAKSGADTELRAAKNNFQCNWDHQLVESPFTGQPVFQFTNPLIIHSSFINYYTLGEYSAEQVLSSLRGPPTRA
ncbi:MAG: hypothetical protein WDO16_06190 [Bacteroidota bacterium]